MPPLHQRTRLPDPLSYPTTVKQHNKKYKRNPEKPAALILKYKGIFGGGCCGTLKSTVHSHTEDRKRKREGHLQRAEKWFLCDIKQCYSTTVSFLHAFPFLKMIQLPNPGFASTTFVSRLLSRAVKAKSEFKHASSSFFDAPFHGLWSAQWRIRLTTNRSYCKSTILPTDESLSVVFLLLQPCEVFLGAELGTRITLYHNVAQSCQIDCFRW